MATGYMTLPLPVLGNTYALEDPSGYSKYQRGTPSPYWAVLWNRCLMIIDDHAHETSGQDSGGFTGKTLSWGSASTNGIKICSDLDMSLRAERYHQVLGVPQKAYDMLYAGLSKKVNIVDETKSIIFRNMESDSFPPPLNDTWDFRSSLYCRLRYNEVNYNTAATGADAADNYSYVPSQSLVWNNGGADKEGTEIVNNEPGGARPGAWAFTGFPNDATDTEMYYDPLTLQPFLGIQDTGRDGYKWTYTSTNASYNMYAAFHNQYGWFGTWYSTTGAGDILIRSNPSAKGVSKFDSTTGLSDAATMFASAPGTEFAIPFRLGKFIWITDMGNNAGTNAQTIKVDPYYLGGDETIIRWYDSGTASMKYYQASTDGPDSLQLDSNKESILLVKADYELWFAYFK